MKHSDTSPTTRGRRRFILGRNLAVSAAMAVLAGGAIVNGTALTLDDSEGNPDTSEQDRKGKAAARVARDNHIIYGLSDAHGCWSGDQPADMVGKIPGHSILTLPGDEFPRYYGAKATGLALDQLPKAIGGPGLNHGITVHAYCR